MPSLVRSAASRSRRGLAFLCLSLVSYGIPRPAAADDAPVLVMPIEEVGLAAEDRAPSEVVQPPDLRHAGPIHEAQGYGGEIEPNGTPATATPLTGPNVVVRSNIWPAADIDVYSFTAQTGDRVYATSMTSYSGSLSTNGRLTLLASDGTTVIENDEDNGTFPANAPSIAGATIPADGTYFLRVVDATATATERPYELHFRLQSAATPPTAEVEPNDTPATANVLPANGWVSGTRDPALAAEQDWYSLSLNAGDTVFLSLDLDPERDGVNWNGRVGLGPSFGDANNLTLVIDDAGSAETPVTIPSEAYVMTVKASGTYAILVDATSGAVGGPTATYHLSASVHPATEEGGNCTVYTSTDVPKVIPATGGLVSSTINVPGNPRIADVDVSITMDHLLFADVDVHLRSPANNDNAIFTDVGPTAVGGQVQMDTTFDDEAAITPNFYLVFKGMQLKPEANYRLDWFDGENAGGTWTLDVRDDVNNVNGGNLTAWSIKICEPPPPPSCPAGTSQATVFTTDFESGPAGFTHSGTADEWELGLPATALAGIAPFNSCNSGVNCWKTDLDNTYNQSAGAGSPNVTQDLLSAPIDLTGLQPPVLVSWAQRYQIESANFDHYSVDLRQVGGANPVRLYEWMGATMQNGVALPTLTIGESSGWGTVTARADSLAGTSTELLFHLDSDFSVNLGGVAVDDVTVTACRPVADLAITKTDGLITAIPGQLLTYTITASNAGPADAPSATVADTFPPEINCPTWTCVGAGGGNCTGSGSGHINDNVSLPAGGSVTYTANCGVGTLATGTLVNTATVASSLNDPNPANNSATDIDTLVPTADLEITKNDGVLTAVPGQTVLTYVIAASNAAGPSDVSATVADTFPAALTCNWTCVGSGPNAGTCTPSGSGNISDAVTLPNSGTVTYTAVCSIAPGATGSLSNTATVATSATDPNPGNNSATDIDTLAAEADVAVGLTVNNPTPTVGSNVTFSLSATNNGPSAATGVVVTDLLPAGLAFVSATASQGTYSAVTGAWTIGGIGSGATQTLSIVATVNTANALVNQASKTAQGETDPDRSNNTAVVGLNGPTLADVQVQETADNLSPAMGNDVTFTVTAHNAGPGNATGVVLTDNLPAGLAFLSATASQGTYSSATGVWTVGSINSGATAMLTVVMDVTSTLPTTRVVNKTAQVEPDVEVTNDSDSVTLNDTTVADLALSMIASQEPVPMGATFHYTIAVANHGPASATGVTVTDSLPAGLSFVSATASQGSCTGTTSISCALGDLADGGSASVVLVVQKTVGGSVSNTASVAATQGDPYMANNTNGEVTTPAALIDFKVQ